MMISSPIRYHPPVMVVSDSRQLTPSGHGHLSATRSPTPVHPAGVYYSQPGVATVLQGKLRTVDGINLVLRSGDGVLRVDTLGGRFYWSAQAVVGSIVWTYRRLKKPVVGR